MLFSGIRMPDIISAGLRITGEEMLWIMFVILPLPGKSLWITLEIVSVPGELLPILPGMPGFSGEDP